MSGKTDAKIRRLGKQIEEEAGNAPYGIKPDELIAYAGDRRWPIKPDSWKLKLELAQLQDAHHAKVKKIIARAEATGTSAFAEQVKADMQAARKVLELVLDKFEYDKVAKEVDTDALSFIAADLVNFLVVSGGAAGLPRSRMLHNLDTLSRLISTKEPQPSTEPSSVPSTGSGA